ncbi:MAG: ribosome recycling factor [Tepidisphaeraceae bacterium]
MPLDDILIDLEMQLEKAAEHLHEELKTVRTGRASPALVEHVKVEYYGSLTDVRSIASITVPEATQIVVKPFNKADLKALEKAIGDSKSGLTPHSDGVQLRINLPPMSQERRAQMAGQCKQMGETTKITIRNARRDANKILETEKKGGIVTEDEATRGKEQIDELTKQYEKKVEEYVAKKQHEITQV